MILYLKKLQIHFLIQSMLYFILRYVSDIINRIMPEDERLQRYERAIVMTILGLSYAMRKLDRTYLDEDNIREIWEPFLKEKRVWKLIKHNSPLVSIDYTSTYIYI